MTIAVPNGSPTRHVGNPAAPAIGRTPVDEVVSLPRTLGVFVHGRSDPTTRRGPGRFVRATITPDGPATLELRWDRDVAAPGRHGLDARGWGPGAEWMLARVPAMTGQLDRVPELPAVHAAVTTAAHDHRDLRIGSSGDLYHELLPTVLAQRITAGEAVRQWSRLCRTLGEPAPGPHGDTSRLGPQHALVLPPAPATLVRRPAWWFHPLGIEAKRAVPLTEVARSADRLWTWADDPTVGLRRLASLRGIGPWTIGSVGGPALGDPDALAVGDFHFKNVVAFALTGEPRGTDERMLELLEPYAGQRGRVLRLLLSAGWRAPKFGPRRRVLPMHRW